MYRASVTSGGLSSPFTVVTTGLPQLSLQSLSVVVVVSVGMPRARLMLSNHTTSLVVGGQATKAEDKTIRFRFSPKEVKTFAFTIRGNVPSLDARTGGITAVLPSPELARQPSAKVPNWWTDDPSPELAEGPHHGAKTVSRWREDFLRDFAARMERCKSPASKQKRVAAAANDDEHA